jgi:SRSO17 transposase
MWTWVEGELYLPEKWFSPAWARQRQKAAIPPPLRYQKQSELGWQRIARAQAAGIPFVAVAFDSGYGHEAALRDRWRAAGIEYDADIKGGEVVYFSDPTQPLTAPGVSRINWLQQHGWRVAQGVQPPPIAWQTLTLRPDARGILTADFAAYPVGTGRDDGQIVADTLLRRRDPTRITYPLTHAAPNTPLSTLAQRKSQRFFVERSIQDAQSELGFDEFQALKYRAWQHHLALTILASWFIAETRLDWAAEHPPDPSLLDQYDTDVLPAWSLANVRELLRVALPLPRLSAQQAAVLMVQQLDNRTRSRLKKHSGP